MKYTKNPISHREGGTDKRYKLSLVFSGMPRPQVVAYFCNEKLGFFDSQEQAIEACKSHQLDRLKEMNL